MHWAKASSVGFAAPDPAAVAELAEPVDDGLPLHAATSRARATTAMRCFMPTVLGPGG
jgi:hypothetical protein